MGYRCGIRAQGSDTRPERGSTCINRIIYLKHVYWFFLFFFLNYASIEFSKLTAGMERLEEYANKESSFTKWINSKKEPIQE